MLLIHVLPYSFSNLLLANIGVPLFTTNVFWQVMLLIPIMLIELFAHSRFLKINLFKAFKISFITNLFSTLLGIIINIIFAVFGVIDSFEAPLDNRFLILFVVFRILGFLILWITSVQTEYWLGLRLVKGAEKDIFKKSFLKANSLSYVFLAIVMTSSIMMNLSKAHNSITIIQKDLTDFDRMCPVVVKSDACDQVFNKRIESYQKLSQIYCKHNDLKNCMNSKFRRINELREATAKTCSQDDQRVVCQKTR